MDAIRNIYRDYALAWEKGDAELWLSIWDEAGTQMPPGIPSRNKDDLREIMCSSSNLI